MRAEGHGGGAFKVRGLNEETSEACERRTNRGHRE